MCCALQALLVFHQAALHPPAQPSTCTSCLPASLKIYWHRQQLNVLLVTGAPGASSGPTSSAQDVHQLLASIPQDLLAQAAAQCGAHARALLHYETHLRSKEGGGLNPVAHKNIYYSDDEVSFLQVCGGSLRKCFACRKQTMSA